MPYNFAGPENFGIIRKGAALPQAVTPPSFVQKDAQTRNAEVTPDKPISLPSAGRAREKPVAGFCHSDALGI
jgi:hypothetical protein